MLTAEMKVKWRRDRRSCNRNLSNCQWSTKKDFVASTDIEPMRCALAQQCSTSWAIKTHTSRADQVIEFISTRERNKTFVPGIGSFVFGIDWKCELRKYKWNIFTSSFHLYWLRFARLLTCLHLLIVHVWFWYAVHFMWTNLLSFLLPESALRTNCQPLFSGLTTRQVTFLQNRYFIQPLQSHKCQYDCFIFAVSVYGGLNASCCSCVGDLSQQSRSTPLSSIAVR